MERNAIKAATRKAKREKRLGEDAVCVLCGHSDLDALTPVGRTTIEAHHVLGKAYDEALTVPLCANCHGSVTEQNRTVGAPMKAPPSFLEKLVSILRSVGNFLCGLGDSLLKMADTLLNLIRGLDRHFPGWRGVEETA